MCRNIAARRVGIFAIGLRLSAPYRWAAGTASVRPDLAHLYLNEPAFLLRTFVALIGWSILAVLIVQRRCNPLTAAIGLAFHGLIISFVAVDWILSIDVGFGSSAFAAGFAIQQILAALAFTAVVAPEPDSDTAADLGGLLMAALLGTAYIDLMSFIVSWYGDLPDKAAWYLRRGQDGWNWVILSAVLVGALVPIAMLLSSRTSREPAGASPDRRSYSRGRRSACFVADGARFRTRCNCSGPGRPHRLGQPVNRGSRSNPGGDEKVDP